MSGPSDFFDSEFAELELMSAAPGAPEGGAPYLQVLKKLDSLSRDVASLNTSFSEVKVRYEFLADRMQEREVTKDKDFAEIKESLARLDTRVQELERFQWKLIGGVAAAVVVAELIMKVL